MIAIFGGCTLASWPHVPVLLVSHVEPKCLHTGTVCRRSLRPCRWSGSRYDSSRFRRHHHCSRIAWSSRQCLQDSGGLKRDNGAFRRSRNRRPCVLVPVVGVHAKGDLVMRHSGAISLHPTSRGRTVAWLCMKSVSATIAMAGQLDHMVLGIFHFKADSAPVVSFKNMYHDPMYPGLILSTACIMYWKMAPCSQLSTQMRIIMWYVINTARKGNNVTYIVTLLRIIL